MRAKTTAIPLLIGVPCKGSKPEMKTRDTLVSLLPEKGLRMCISNEIQLSSEELGNPSLHNSIQQETVVP